MSSDGNDAAGLKGSRAKLLGCQAPNVSTLFEGRGAPGTGRSIPTSARWCSALDWAVPIGFAATLCLVAPLGAAMQFGHDEGYEFMKGLLVSLGHRLYFEIWNDQPPLYTEILALLFRLFGPSALVGRLLAVGFSTLLVWSLYKTVSRGSGRLAGIIAVALLAASPSFLQLSVSVMIELPAVALALAAVWSWSRYYAGGGKAWLVLSGICFGCALQVKLTAVMFLPALVCDYLMRRGFAVSSGSENGSAQNVGKPLPTRSHGWMEHLLWSGAALGAFGFILLVWYRSDALPIFWLSHFSKGTRAAAEVATYGFDWQSIASEFELAIPTVLGLLGAALTRRRHLLLPAVLLATAFGIHLWHRPYWDYYVLHFTVPMAWLGGAGIVEWFRILWQRDLSVLLRQRRVPTALHPLEPDTSAFPRLEERAGERRPLVLQTPMPSRHRRRALMLWHALATGVGYAVWSLVLALVLSTVPENIWNKLTALRSVPRADKDRLVSALKRHAAQTHWVFTSQVICAFRAGLPVPPELAVIPLKRIWSGQITSGKLIESLERYRPEQIALPGCLAESPAVSDYLSTHYKADTADPSDQILLRSDGVSRLYLP